MAHPITWSAVGLLLINDYVLRVYWPSWWTGKIGDFAWLFFAPLVLASLLAWLVPPTWKYQGRMVGGLACLVIAVVFSLVKIFPASHSWLVHLVGSALQIPVGWRRDPSDLVALPSIILAWWFWERQSFEMSRPVKGVLVTLSLAAFLTIANSVGPRMGMNCLVTLDDHVIAYSNYQDSFSTADGGVSWQQVNWDSLGTSPYCQSGEKQTICILTDGTPGGCSYTTMPPNPAVSPSDQGQHTECKPTLPGDEGICTFPPASIESIVMDPNDPGRQFRYQPGVSIEQSSDGGKTWQLGYRLSTSEAERDYLAADLQALTAPAPLAGKVDPTTGNAIFAMGLQGLLVYRTENAAWQWVPLGGYAYMEISPGELVLALLPDEFFLALILGLLSVITLALIRARRASRVIWVLIGWLLWAVPAVLLRYPHGYDPYGMGGILVMGFIIAAGLIAFFLSYQSFGQVGRLWLGATIVNMVLYFLPYLLWVLALIPSYQTARIFALSLSGAALLEECVLLIKRRRTPPAPL